MIKVEIVVEGEGKPVANTVATCDECGAKKEWAGEYLSWLAARKQLREKGWKLGGKHLCPECAV